MREYTAAKNTHTVKLCLLTQLAVFIDILPSYRIRSLTDKEKTTRVTKDLLQQRDQEQKLLTHYHSFIQSLDRIAKSHTSNALKANEASNTLDISVMLVCVRCMTELLRRCWHFNFSEILVKFVINRSSLILPPHPTIPSDACITLCTAAVAHTFQADLDGKVSHEIVFAIHDVVKNHQLKVKPHILECLLSLSLSVSCGKPVPKKDMRSKRKKTIEKAQLELEREIKEANGAFLAEEKQRMVRLFP